MLAGLQGALDQRGHPAPVQRVDGQLGLPVARQRVLGVPLPDRHAQADQGTHARQRVAQALDRLALPDIGPDGRLMEWREPYDEPEPGHRHMSHLYGLHPGNQISTIRTPELAEAAMAMALMAPAEVPPTRLILASTPFSCVVSSYVTEFIQFGNIQFTRFRRASQFV